MSCRLPICFGPPQCNSQKKPKPVFAPLRHKHMIVNYLLELPLVWRTGKRDVYGAQKRRAFTSPAHLGALRGLQGHCRCNFVNPFLKLFPEVILWSQSCQKLQAATSSAVFDSVGSARRWRCFSPKAQRAQSTTKAMKPQPLGKTKITQFSRAVSAQKQVGQQGTGPRSAPSAAYE